MGDLRHFFVGYVLPTPTSFPDRQTQTSTDTPRTPPTPRQVTVCMWFSGLGLLVTSAVTFWIGFQDLFLPVSLAAQFVGLAYFLTGLVGLVGVVGLISLADLARRYLGKKQKPFDDDGQPNYGWRRKRTSPPIWQIAFAFSGAAAGCYADLTIVWYSRGYQMIITWVFSVLALLCFFLACVMLPAILVVWKYIATGLKGLGISAALLALAAQFWYVSVYAPENTPAAMNATFTVSSMIGTGSHRVAQVDLTIENTGSVAAVAVGSILVVNGISYPSGRTTILTVLPPYGNTGWLFPNNPISYDFPVRITNPGINALKFELTFVFARTTWLRLGKRRGSSTENVPGCMPSPSDRQSEWYVVESRLYNFSQGTKVLYSDYCDPKYPTDQDPWVTVGFAGVRGGRLVAIPEQSSGPGLGIIPDYQSDTIVLGRALTQP